MRQEVFRKTRFLAGVGVALAAVAVVAAAIFLEFVMCANTFVAAVPSPNGEHSAVVFERSCGATTGFSTQISLGPLFGRRPLGGGNLWIADTSNGAAPAATWGGPEVSVEWMSTSELKVSNHPEARVFKAEPGLNGVTVVYLKRSAPMPGASR